jgi:beta-lactamase regulating signal transducer with metallopeptidase domain
VSLPLITLPSHWYHSILGSGSIEHPLSLTFLNANNDSFSEASGSVSQEFRRIELGAALAYLFMGLYISGVLFGLIQLAKKLLSIRRSIRQHNRERRDDFWLIPLEIQSPAYSFMNYIFISKNLENLSASDMERIFTHETIHAKQGHSLDILFAELVSVLFWFNPLMKAFRRYLTEVHEYLADEKTINNTEMKKSYSHLLLKLTTEEQPFKLSSAFSAKQISRRILMMEKARSIPRQKFSFLLLLPAAVVLLMSFSYFENRSSASPVILEDQASEARASYQLKVGKISWEGNTIFTDTRLSEELRIKTGDAYSKDYLNERLYTDEDALNSLYLDKGYLFFRLEVKEELKTGGTLDLTMSIYEGVQAKIGQIIITGNGSVPKQDVSKVISIKPGELFSKTKLINSVRAIEQLNRFVPEDILVNPTPLADQFNGEYALVDIEFELTEK